MSFQIKEKLIDLNDSLIKSIDSFVYLPKGKLLVFGKDSAFEKANKFKILFEVWDLQNNYVINEGKIDIYAITYLCRFVHFKSDYVANVKSSNGQRSLILFDFVSNNHKTVSANFSSGEFSSKSDLRKTEIFCFPESSTIGFLEVLYFNEQITFKNEKDEYFLYNFLIFKENEEQPFSRLKMRREGSKTDQNFIKVLKGNDRDLIVIFDYTLNEIMLWNTLKNYEDLKYISLNLQEFKLLRAIDQKQSLVFVLKERNYKHIHIMHLNLRDNRCLIQNLFSVDNFDKTLDFSKISYTKVFFFQRYNKLFLFVFVKFQNSFENTHHFLYEFSQEKDQGLLNSKFVLKLAYCRNSINNYFFKQKECIEHAVCLTKPKIQNKSNSKNSNGGNESSQTMRIFSLSTGEYDKILEKLKINFFMAMKKDKIYDEKIIKLIYERLYP